MKLRNKKTDEIVDGFITTIHWRDKLRVSHRGGQPYADYDSLAELNEVWEDYEIAEPLIKDEKIRKAVRAWAMANRIGGCICKEEIHCITFETERGMFISFENADTIPPEGNFTIAELCGEEE